MSMSLSLPSSNKSSTVNIVSGSESQGSTDPTSLDSTKQFYRIQPRRVSNPSSLVRSQSATRPPSSHSSAILPHQSFFTPRKPHKNASSNPSPAWMTGGVSSGPRMSFQSDRNPPSSYVPPNEDTSIIPDMERDQTILHIQHPTPNGHPLSLDHLQQDRDRPASAASASTNHTMARPSKEALLGQTLPPPVTAVSRHRPSQDVYRVSTTTERASRTSGMGEMVEVRSISSRIPDMDEERAENESTVQSHLFPTDFYSANAVSSPHPLLNRNPHDLDSPHHPLASDPSIPFSGTKEELNYQLPRTQTVETFNTFLRDKSGGKVRNWQTHQGQITWFCNGRLQTSGDGKMPLILSATFAVVAPALFFVFNSEFYWKRTWGKAMLIVAGYLTLLMWSSMAKSCLTDPGILPRNLDVWTPGVEEAVDGGGRAVRYINLRGRRYITKWCETCETYRPPRCSHCRLCDNCVEHTDHHCSFLNNCIGRRNYTPFIAFLTFAVTLSVIVIALSIAHVVLAHLEFEDAAPPEEGEPPRNPRDGFLDDWHGIGALVLGILAFAASIPISGLWTYHLRLMWRNATTIEMLRPKQMIQQHNGVFSQGSHLRNYFSILCRPLEPNSYIQAYAYAKKDKRTETS